MSDQNESAFITCQFLLT